jgi:multiple sugar transport system permease protein
MDSAGKNKVSAPGVARMPSRRRSLSSRRGIVCATFVVPALLVLFALTIYPFVYTLLASFHYWYLPLQSLKSFVGLQNYRDYFGDNAFWQALWLTVVFVCISVGLEILLGVPIALLLHSRYVWLGRLWRGLIILPIMVTPIVNGVIWTIAYNYQFGIINYLLRQVGLPEHNWLSDPHLALPAVIVPDVWQWTPFVILVTLAGLQSVPEEPYDAARVDGAGAWQMFIHITLPAMRPYFVVIAILRILFAYRVFDTVYLLTLGGPGTSTEVLSIKVYLTAFNDFMIGQASALAVIILVIVVVLATVFVRRVYADYGDQIEGAQ